MTDKKNLDFAIVQESRWSAYTRQFLNVGFLRAILFSNILQLLPVWVMYIIQLVSKYRFGIEEYVSNFLVFIIISCGVNLADLFTRKTLKINEMSILFVIFLQIFIMCTALILYCLLLLSSLTSLSIITLRYCIFSFIFFIIVVFINLWKEISNEDLEE